MADRMVLSQQEADRASAGPKAASLARMAAAGLAVPPFFVIATEAYRSHAGRAGVAAASASASPFTAADASRYRESIASAPLDPALARDVLDALGALGDGPFAVRSSGTAEDLPGLSFAGQHGTYFAWDAGEVLLRLADCWASLWTDRAFGYRVRQGVPHEDAAMAVIVQRLVSAEAAGVAFTADPVTGARLVTVEGCHGIGEALVSGRVAPDRWVFSRPDLTTLESRAGLKPVALFVTSDGHVEETALPPQRAKAPCLADEAAREVARLALEAESVLGAQVDIEWAAEGGRLWLLQARPITTAPSDAPRPRHRPTAWSNVNTGEVLPDVVTPMTWSVVGGLATGLIMSLFGKLGIGVDPERLTTLIGGRCYFNAALLGSAFEKMPFTGDTSVTSVFGGMEAPPEMAAVLALPPDERDVARVSAVRVLIGLPQVAIWVLGHSPARAERLLREAAAGTAETLSAIDGAGTEDDLAAAARGVIDSLGMLVDMIAFAAVGMARHSALLSIARRRFGEEGPPLVNTLLAAQGGVASAESGLALSRLAGLARSEPGIAAVLGRSASPWPEARADIEALARTTPAAAGFLAGWDAFMTAHGHHTRGELEFAAPRWAERPDDVRSMLVVQLAQRPDDDLAVAWERRARAAGEAEEAALARLGPLSRGRFRRSLQGAREGARMRENLKNEGVRRLAAGRRALLALGAAMTARGVLAAPDDIFFLRWDEVTPVRSGALDPRPLVTSRRARYERDRGVTPPPVVIGEWDGAPAPAATGEVSDTLTGLAVASGVARGRARVIRSLQRDDRVLPGEVLVAPFTDPGWTPLFVPAVAIVVDMGGMLSHGSIIAREYGIPAVVNVGTGTSAIRTGDLVEVDGDRGVVRVIERA